MRLVIGRIVQRYNPHLAGHLVASRHNFVQQRPAGHDHMLSLIAQRDIDEQWAIYEHMAKAGPAGPPHPDETR